MELQDYQFPAQPSTACQSRYDICRVLLFENNDGQFVEFLDPSRPQQFTLSPKTHYILSSIDTSYTINFILILAQESHSVLDLLIGNKKRIQNTCCGLFYTKPVFISVSNTLLYLIQFNHQSGHDILWRILASTLPLLSQILVQTTYPLQPSRVTGQLRFINELKRWQSQLQKLQKYFPQIILVCRANTEQLYTRRNKNGDSKIFNEYMHFSQEQQINKIVRCHFRRRDCVVIGNTQEFSCPEIGYLRMKILKYQVKPPTFFNFNSRKAIDYVTYILGNADSPLLNFKQISKAISQQSLRFKPVGMKASQQTTYNVWANQIDNLFLSKFSTEMHSDIQQCLSSFEKDIHLQLLMAKQKAIADKASLICQQQKRLQSFLNEPLMSELCHACGFHYTDVKPYIDQKIVELEERQKQMEVSNLNLDSFHSSNG